MGVHGVGGGGGTLPWSDRPRYVDAVADMMGLRAVRAAAGEGQEAAQVPPCWAPAV